MASLPVHRPDPYPVPGPPVSYFSYTYVTPALWKRGPDRGDRIAGWWFRCTVPAVWRGRVNLAGHRRCVLFKR